MALEGGFRFGLKIVRGAYMEKNVPVQRKRLPITNTAR